MAAGTQHINIHLIYIDRYLSVCLYRICMEQNAVFFCNRSDLFHRLDRSYLIVGKHDSDQNRIRANRRF